MSERLKADVGMIRRSADTVDRIRTALNSSPATVDNYEHAIGQHALSHALHDFATNWKLHREKISHDLQTFSAWARKAADEYEHADRELAKAVQGKGGNG